MRRCVRRRWGLVGASDESLGSAAAAGGWCGSWSWSGEGGRFLVFVEDDAGLAEIGDEAGEIVADAGVVEDGGEDPAAGVGVFEEPFEGVGGVADAIGGGSEFLEAGAELVDGLIDLGEGAASGDDGRVDGFGEAGGAFHGLAEGGDAGLEIGDDWAGEDFGIDFADRGFEFGEGGGDVAEVFVGEDAGVEAVEGGIEPGETVADVLHDGGAFVADFGGHGGEVRGDIAGEGFAVGDEAGGAGGGDADIDGAVAHEADGVDAERGAFGDFEFLIDFEIDFDAFEFVEEFGGSGDPADDGTGAADGGAGDEVLGVGEDGADGVGPAHFVADGAEFEDEAEEEEEA